MSSLVTRKAIQNRSSFFVYLPQTWAIQTGLRKGDTLAITLSPSGGLLIEHEVPE